MHSHLFTYRVPQRQTRYLVTATDDGYKVVIVQSGIKNTYTFKTMNGVNVFIKLHKQHS